MNNLTHNIIGWCAGLAIGMTIGVSLNNIALGIGVGVAIGAGLASTQMKKQNSSSENRVAPYSWGFLFEG